MGRGHRERRVEQSSCMQGNWSPRTGWGGTSPGLEEGRGRQWQPDTCDVSFRIRPEGGICISATSQIGKRSWLSTVGGGRMGPGAPGALGRGVSLSPFCPPDGPFFHCLPPPHPLSGCGEEPCPWQGWRVGVKSDPTSLFPMGGTAWFSPWLPPESTEPLKIARPVASVSASAVLI